MNLTVTMTLQTGGCQYVPAVISAKLEKEEQRCLAKRSEKRVHFFLRTRGSFPLMHRWSIKVERN
jgi:hypothetical protein